MTVIAPPPSRIYLMRHAEAVKAGPGEADFDRALSDTGYAQAETIADRAADKRYRPDIILSSTAMRCRETAQALHRAFNEQCDIVHVDQIYTAGAEDYLALIGAQPQNAAVMLVGHNPAIAQALALLIGEPQFQARLLDGYPTAGLAVLDPLDAGGEDGGQQPGWRLSDFLLA